MNEITPDAIAQYDKNELSSLFSIKTTENGDIAFKSTGNHLVDLLMFGEYYSKHLDCVKIGTSDIEKVFSMFIRDPRYGLKYREYGRTLMYQACVSPENVVKAGRFDDLWRIVGRGNDELEALWVNYLLDQCMAGNNLAKKWMPHYTAKQNGKPSVSTVNAARFRRILGLTKQEYGKLVKCDTVESKLSQHHNDEIDFSKLPSLALLKYWARFAGTSKKNPKTDMAERFKSYLESVKKGEKKMNMSTASVYDIYRKRNDIDADVAFAQIEKISGNWIPIVDTSASMLWKESNDAMGKALAIGHYLAKCSTYAPNQVISFSSEPQLIELGVTKPHMKRSIGITEDNGTQYCHELRSMHTGDCSNTDFGAVMRILSGLRKEFPEFLVVLSDQEFDEGSNSDTRLVLSGWCKNGINTKIVWWNLNSRATTTQFRNDEFGNIFLSGYNPQLLKFLEAGFDGSSYLAKLLNEYKKSVGLD